MPESTNIDHSGGGRTTVETNERGEHTVTRTDKDGAPTGGGQAGSGRSHADVVKEHTLPGDKVSK